MTFVILTGGMDLSVGSVIGVSINGGEGSILGVVVGVLLMSTLTNGMVLMDISEFWQKFVKGVVLILAVSLDRIVQKSKEKAA